MDWANEKYVRLFTRDTPEWLVLPWQAKALWPLMVRKFDRSGVLATKLGARGVAVLVGLPLEVVEPGLTALLEDGCLEFHELGYLAPNYLEAQETPQSDANRQRESRERRRQRKSLSTSPSDVLTATKCHAVSRGVTSGHAVSQPVTPDQTRPDQKEIADPPKPELALPLYPEANGMGPRGEQAVKPDPAEALADVAVGEINRLSGRTFGLRSKETLGLCRGLLKNKHGAEEVLLVIRSKVGWVSDSNMTQHFEPKTLLGPRNFERYLDAARAGPPKVIANTGARVQRFASTRTDDEPDLPSLPIPGVQ